MCVVVTLELPMALHILQRVSFFFLELLDKLLSFHAFLRNSGRIYETNKMWISVILDHPRALQTLEFPSIFWYL